MPTYDPLESALDAFVTYFGAALSGTADVQKGWPEPNEELSLTTRPLLTVHAATSPSESPCSPGSVDRDGSTVTYRVGYLSFTVVLTLWTAYKAEREDVSPSVEALFHNALPAKTGLYLTSTNYHSRPITAELGQGGGLLDEQGASADVGEWRRAWHFEVETDRVADATVPQLDAVDIGVTVTVDGVATPEETETIP